MGARQLPRLAALVMVTAMAACQSVVVGAPPTKFVIAVGAVAYGPPDNPADTTPSGFARCPYVRGTTLGLSIHRFADMRLSADGKRCERRK